MQKVFREFWQRWALRPAHHYPQGVFGVNLRERFPSLTAGAAPYDSRNFTLETLVYGTVKDKGGMQ
jgi:hypothetical protein